MAIITVEGLGQVEIAGTAPNAQEIEAIKQALNSNTDLTGDQKILTIDEYKKQNPDSANVPDRDLAQALYEKNFKDKMDETTFYKTVFPQIAEKRSDDVYNDFVFPDDDFGSGFDSTTPFKPTTSELAQKSGVSLNNPADGRAIASLGYDQSQQMLAIKNTMSKAFDQEVDVRVGPNTGELEYYNPKIEKYALVNQPGLDTGDFGAMTGDLMVVIPDIAATLYVGGLTAGVGGIAAGAAAAMVMEYARLKMGQVYGLNKDMTDEQMWRSTSTAAGVSLGAGVLGLGAIKAIKGINNLINGRVVSDDAMEALSSTAVKETDAVAKTINDTLDGAKIKSKLKYTLAQATDDPDLLASQHAFENSKRLGRVSEFREFGREQADALNDYFGFLKSGFGTLKNVTPTTNVKTIGQKIIESGNGKIPTTFDAGVMVQEVIKDAQDPIVQNIVKKQIQSEELLTKSIFNLPDGSTKITGETTRTILKDLGKKYKIAVKKAGDSLDKAAGVKVIKTDLISKTINKLSAKEKITFVNAAKAEGVFKKELFDKLTDEFESIPLDGARETVKSLTKIIRDKGVTGSLTGEPGAGGAIEIGKVMKIKSVFMEQIRKNAGKHYVNEMENFNDIVITGKKLLNNETILKLSSKENGIYKLADQDVFATTFKRGIGSDKAAQEAYDVIKQSPDALQAYKNSIYEFYKTKVLTNNKPNLTKHNSFIKSYEAPLKQFFNSAEYTKISRIGGLQKIIERNAKIDKQTTDKLFKSFEGRLESGSPQDLFKKIYASDKIGEIRELKNILKDSPEVYKAFQRNVLTDLSEKITVSDDRLGMKVLDSKALDTYLVGKSGERGHKVVLEQIFGKEYVNNLETLSKALKILSRKAPSVQAEGFFANVLTDILRTHLGQFTKPGRMLTAGRRVFTSASNRVIGNALLNPQSLKLLIELKNLKPNSKRAAIILHKLGGHIFIADELFNTPLVPQDKKDIPETPYNPSDQSSNTSNIEEIIQTTDNVMTASLPNTIETGDTSKLQTPPLDTVGANPAFFNDKIMAQAPNSNTMLSASDEAFLDNEEKAMRERGIG